MTVTKINTTHTSSSTSGEALRNIIEDEFFDLDNDIVEDISNIELQILDMEQDILTISGATI